MVKLLVDVERRDSVMLDTIAGLHNMRKSILIAKILHLYLDANTNGKSFSELEQLKFE